MTTPLCDIGNRLELLVDTWLVEALHGSAALHLHSPTPREAALVTDRPWEGNMCGCVTVLRDGDRYRMYYHTGQFNLSGEECSHWQPDRPGRSSDGIHERPEQGCTKRAARGQQPGLWRGGVERGARIAPFIDARPDVPRKPAIRR